MHGSDSPEEGSERARESARHESIVRALGDPVCTFDTDGQFVYVNEAFETELGYDREQALEHELTLVTSEDDADHLTTLAAELRAADKQTTETVEVEIQTHNAGTIPTECHVAVLPESEAGRETVAVFRDISRRKQREQRLIKLASVVSHDLRNPMDVALGRAEVLPDIADVDEETEKHLDEIFNALKRMEQLIEEVLTLSRQSAEVVEVSTVSLEDIAREAWNNVDTVSATLTVTDDVAIQAHRSRLLRLLENLFRNSVEHGSTSNRPEADDSVEHGSTGSRAGPDDSVEHGSTSNRPEADDSVEHGDGDVTVEVGVLDTQWETAETGFYVADDGSGIPADQRDDIFEDGFSTSKNGTGLGLSIVRDTAAAHDWSVKLADSDEGARFEITGVSLPEP
jgi:PAS domain S-box-containing protein